MNRAIDYYPQFVNILFVEMPDKDNVKVKISEKGSGSLKENEISRSSLYDAYGKRDRLRINMQSGELDVIVGKNGSVCIEGDNKKNVSVVLSKKFLEDMRSLTE